MKAPQIIMIVLYSAALLSNAAYHGKPREGEYNVWTALFGVALSVGLLTWGGFFG